MASRLASLRALRAPSRVFAHEPLRFASPSSRYSAVSPRLSTAPLATEAAQAPSSALAPSAIPAERPTGSSNDVAEAGFAPPHAPGHFADKDHATFVTADYVGLTPGQLRHKFSQADLSIVGARSGSEDPAVARANRLLNRALGFGSATRGEWMDVAQNSFVDKYGRRASDFGHPAVALAQMSAKIRDTAEHLKHSPRHKRAKVQMNLNWGKRRRMMRFMRRAMFREYEAVCTQEGIVDPFDPRFTGLHTQRRYGLDIRQEEKRQKRAERRRLRELRSLSMTGDEPAAFGKAAAASSSARGAKASPAAAAAAATDSTIPEFENLSASDEISDPKQKKKAPALVVAPAAAGDV